LQPHDQARAQSALTVRPSTRSAFGVIFEHLLANRDATRVESQKTKSMTCNLSAPRV
jgi:hypothetical protein